MKKVLKLNATVIKNKLNKPCVRLDFQTFKDGKTNFGGHVIIYRREETNYVYDYDEGEYFNCLLPTENDIIFDGELPIENTFSTYFDNDVEIGKVYAYWVGRESFGKFLTGPIPIKVRDLNVWWHYDDIVNKIFELQRKYSAVSVKQVGFTVLRKPLYAVYVGNTDNLIAGVGAIHGGESGPEILISAVSNILSENPNFFDKCGIAFMPVINADMREKMVSGTPWYIRANAVSVDLNRNFDADFNFVDKSYNLSSDDYRSPTYRGPYPNSEPETQAVINFFNTINPNATFSYHCLSSISDDMFLTSKSAKNDNCYYEKANAIYKVYSNGFRDALNLPRRENLDVKPTCTSGSLPEYLYTKNVVAFDIELSFTIEEFLVCRYDKTTPEILNSCIKGHIGGIKKVIEYFSK